MQLRTLALVACGLALAGAAYAANTGSIGANAGVSIPTGDLGDAAGIGFNIGGEYTYMLNEQFGVGGDLVYHKFGKKDVTVLTSTVSSEFSALQYTVHGKYWLPSKGDVKPYGKVGLGMYSVTGKVSSNVSGIATGDNTDTKFGFNIGVGADWKISDKMGWNAQATYHSVDSGNANFFTLGAGLHWGIGY